MRIAAKEIRQPEAERHAVKRSESGETPRFDDGGGGGTRDDRQTRREQRLPAWPRSGSVRHPENHPRHDKPHHTLSQRITSERQTAPPRRRAEPDVVTRPVLDREETPDEKDVAAKVR